MPLDPTKLREARESRGLSQRDLAQKLNTTQPHVQGWEKGKWQPSLGNLEALAKVLNVPLTRLMGDAA